MTQDSTTGAEPGGSNPDEFDFASYITGNSTFPTFTHRLYLNQEAGIKLNRAADEYDGLVKRVQEISRVQERASESAARSLVDEASEQLAEELEKAEARLGVLGPVIDRLTEEIRKTALVLHFQTGTAQKLGAVVQQAEKEFHKKNGRKDDSNIEYITAKSQYILASQLAHYCTKLELADGTERDVPSHKDFEVLLSNLISSEMVRLMTKMNEELDASSDWADRVDAGFPGGRTEQDEEPLGSARAAGGEGLDSPSAHDADG